MGLVIFDMDGVLVDSEQVWDQARRDVVDAHGGALEGLGDARHARDELEGVVGLRESRSSAPSCRPSRSTTPSWRRCCAGYEAHLPLLPGAREAIERLGARHTLGLASSSNRPVIDVVLETMGVTDRFAATVSSEEVARGKPAPDVYLEVMRRLGGSEGYAIEDSENGIRSAHAAGLRVIAHPEPALPAGRTRRSRWPTRSCRTSTRS